MLLDDEVCGYPRLVTGPMDPKAAHIRCEDRCNHRNDTDLKADNQGPKKKVEVIDEIFGRSGQLLKRGIYNRGADCPSHHTGDDRSGPHLPEY